MSVELRVTMANKMRFQKHFVSNNCPFQQHCGTKNKEGAILYALEKKKTKYK